MTIAPQNTGGTVTTADPLIGSTLDDRYRVDRLIARGGMATVYAGSDLRLDRPVAIKVLHATLAEDPEFVSRFEREARTAARLSHPNVVAVHDQGSDGDRVFLVMEYVEGRTLRDLLVERGRLTPQEALTILQPALAGLAAAHRAGLVHRDIKPENVLIAADGRVKVADFGLTRAVGNRTAATQGVLIGTVAYLAPEQVARGVADARSDVYATGVVLFELLTGRPPFSGDTPLSVAYQHVHEQVPAPSSVQPGLPEATDALVTTATRPDPDDRPADAAELLTLVDRTLATLPAAAQAPDLQQTLIVALPDTAAAGSGPVNTAPVATGRRRRWPWVVGILTLITALLAGGAWYLGSARYTTAPAVLGMDQATAETALTTAELTPVVGDPVFSETVAAGLVVAAEPGAGAEVRKGSEVVLSLSKGPERYAVPKVTGTTQQAASAAITGANLTVGAVTQEYSSKVPEGQVISSDPAAGTKLKKSTPVALVVSKGPAPVKVPTVTGQSQSSAQSELSNAGLKSTVSGSEFSESVAAGAVIRQSPAPGQTVKRGSTVSLVVSKGPPLVTVPNVLDKKVAAATSALQAAGFKVKVNKPPVVILDRVLSQSPGPGAQAPKGSTITITAI